MNHDPDFILSAVKMLGALIVVLGALSILFYFMKHIFVKQSYGSNRKQIRVLENCYLGVKKNISLIEVPGAILVLGITNDRIVLLTKIKNKEIIDNVMMNQNEIQSAPFLEKLNYFKKRSNS